MKKHASEQSIGDVEVYIQALKRSAAYPEATHAKAAELRAKAASLNAEADQLIADLEKIPQLLAEAESRLANMQALVNPDVQKLLLKFKQLKELES